MQIGYEVDLVSLQKLRRTLDGYTNAQGKAAMRKGCRWGAKIIANAVKSNTPRDTGRLAQNIKVRAIKRSRKSVGVMVKFGEGWYGGETFYGAFVEFGHRIGIRKSRSLKKSGFGDERKKVEGKHFMLHAFKSVRSAAERVTIQRMIYELEKMVPKNG